MDIEEKNEAIRLIITDWMWANGIGSVQRLAGELDVVKQRLRDLELKGEISSVNIEYFALANLLTNNK